MNPSNTKHIITQIKGKEILGIQNKVKERFLQLPVEVIDKKENELQFEKFKIIKEIGEGLYAKIYKAKKDDTYFAIKEIKKEQIQQSNMKTQVQNEVKILYKIKHTSIIKLFTHFETDDKIYLLTEFATNGSLSKELAQVGAFTEDRIRRIIKQLCSAVDYLHNEVKVIHRDLNSENILLDADDNVKIADFGWSNWMPELKKKRMTICGKNEYKAPEIINKLPQTEKVDIWNIGVLIYELFTNQTPFYNPNSVDKLDYNIRNVIFEFPGNIPQQAQDLITKCLQKNQALRLSAKEILSHPFVTGKKEVVADPPKSPRHKIFDNTTQEQKKPQLKIFEVNTDVSTLLDTSMSSNFDDINSTGLKIKKQKIFDKNNSPKFNNSFLVPILPSIPIQQISIQVVEPPKISPKIHQKEVKGDDAPLNDEFSLEGLSIETKAIKYDDELLQKEWSIRDSNQISSITPSPIKQEEKEEESQNFLKLQEVFKQKIEFYQEILKSDSNELEMVQLINVQLKEKYYQIREYAEYETDEPETLKIELSYQDKKTCQNYQHIIDTNMNEIEGLNEELTLKDRKLQMQEYEKNDLIEQYEDLDQLKEKFNIKQSEILQIQMSNQQQYKEALQSNYEKDIYTMNEKIKNLKRSLLMNANLSAQQQAEVYDLIQIIQNLNKEYVDANIDTLLITIRQDENILKQGDDNDSRDKQQIYLKKEFDNKKKLQTEDFQQQKIANEAEYAKKINNIQSQIESYKQGFDDLNNQVENLKKESQKSKYVYEQNIQELQQQTVKKIQLQQTVNTLTEELINLRKEA